MEANLINEVREIHCRKITIYSHLKIFHEITHFLFLVPALERLNLSYKPMSRKIDATRNSGSLHFKLRVTGMTYKGSAIVQ